jgi:hypothetical protein
MNINGSKSLLLSGFIMSSQEVFWTIKYPGKRKNNKWKFFNTPSPKIDNNDKYCKPAYR